MFIKDHKFHQTIKFKMKKIINKFWLTGDKFIPDFQLTRKPGFTYSICTTFTKHCERIQELRETGKLKYLCRNKLDKVCFAHDAAFSDSKDLSKKTISDIVLKEKNHEIARYCKI